MLLVLRYSPSVQGVKLKPQANAHVKPLQTAVKERPPLNNYIYIYIGVTVCCWWHSFGITYCLEVDGLRKGCERP